MVPAGGGADERPPALLSFALRMSIVAAAGPGTRAMRTPWCSGRCLCSDNVRRLERCAPPPIFGRLVLRKVPNGNLGHERTTAARRLFVDSQRSDPPQEFRPSVVDVRGSFQSTAGGRADIGGPTPSRFVNGLGIFFFRVLFPKGAQET